uniref:Uncharacterized protein n=1 Tax=Nelumbo nucifera TaxID=4432 RepID=A0A822Z7I0_NELNU|nr:TPA_asm: hypothetical protein HUJ06_013738 [Nelumbo nucifera]
METWGTWEELLLECAVNRHGTHKWDSVRHGKTKLKLYPSSTNRSEL